LEKRKEITAKERGDLAMALVAGKHPIARSSPETISNKVDAAFPGILKAVKKCQPAGQ
jgi:hypothetical protein